MKKAIILLLGICVMLLSCSKPDIDPNKDSTDNIELTLINTKESIEVDSGVNQVTLSFSTNHSWVATTEASWISLNPNKGNEGEISLVATVEENVADTDRSGVITIAAGNIKKNITIKQSLASNDITFAQGESLTYDISCERHSISIDFASSSTWIATTDADWLLLEPNFGKAGNNISVHVDVAANSSLESRTGIITLSAGKSHKNVTVKQAGIEETLSDELDDIFVAGDAILLPNETSECFAECCNKYGNIIENVDLIWESNKPSVATVNQDGKVTGIAEGIATITASSKDGTVSNYCTIYVADDFSTPVDLGLSVSWSRCDIGSNIPYVLGKLFFWGGATSQSESEWLYKNVPFNGGNREFSPSYWDSVKMSVVDDNNNLLRANDTATILLGDDWRMPKKEEFEELIDNCKIDRLYDGFIFVSKKDGHTDKWLFFNSHFDAKYDTADSYFSSTINENVVKFGDTCKLPWHNLT